MQPIRHHQLDLSLAGGRDHLPTLVDGDSHRLFAEHVKASVSARSRIHTIALLRPGVRGGEGPCHHGAPTLFDGLPLPNGLHFQFDEVQSLNYQQRAEVLQCPPQAALPLDPDGQGFERP